MKKVNIYFLIVLINEIDNIEVVLSTKVVFVMDVLVNLIDVVIAILQKHVSWYCLEGMVIGNALSYLGVIFVEVIVNMYVVIIKQILD